MTPELHRDRLAAARLRFHYGLNPAEYAARVEDQGGVCAICGRPETTLHKGRLRTLCVDHDHTTGAARGLLCNLCNQGVGRFRDDPALLEKAAAYLRSHAR